MLACKLPQVKLILKHFIQNCTLCGLVMSKIAMTVRCHMISDRYEDLEL